MWEANAFWLHPALGIIWLLVVLLTRKDLAAGTSRRQRHWRVMIPLIITGWMIFQILFILRGLYEIGSTVGFVPTSFGILNCIAALILYLGYVRGWYGDDQTVIGG
jgi:ABC-type molybdate transport system permease subunit